MLSIMLHANRRNPAGDALDRPDSGSEIFEVEEI